MNEQELEELEAEYSPYDDAGSTRVVALVAEVRRLRAALEIYGNMYNWWLYGHSKNGLPLWIFRADTNDPQQTAQQALKGGAQ